MKFLLIAFLISSFFIHSQESNYEHIISYHSDLEVQKNCDLIVTEKIKVYANGNRIKRGIYRELPLSYRYMGGNVHVGFELLDIKKDGKSEPYHTSWVSNGIRIYIGEEDVYLNPDFYTYEIKYKVDHVLGFFKDYDEIYWNINGNDWEFEIDSISAKVTFPEGAQLKGSKGFIGDYGSISQDFTVIAKDNSVLYWSGNGLASKENLTVAVSWEKGHLVYPTFLENIWYWIRSYMLWFIGLFAFFW